MCGSTFQKADCGTNALGSTGSTGSPAREGISHAACGCVHFPSSEADATTSGLGLFTTAALAGWTTDVADSASPSCVSQERSDQGSSSEKHHTDDNLNFDKLQMRESASSSFSHHHSPGEHKQFDYSSLEGSTPENATRQDLTGAGQSAALMDLDIVRELQAFVDSELFKQIFEIPSMHEYLSSGAEEFYAPNRYEESCCEGTQITSATTGVSNVSNTAGVAQHPAGDSSRAVEGQSLDDDPMEGSSWHWPDGRDSVQPDGAPSTRPSAGGREEMAVCSQEKTDSFPDGDGERARATSAADVLRSLP
ncbi:unnamed protein product [Rangifer tarandus platyrhynchus]|uniref:Uncharacterized protein n=1 Tax=Rangifer tarandus platyrhynchus TaxID=3082113 RepID=A0ABN8XI63_RANTA|nr:unnamed protein product [Rangifer tarandus platyrhynchus]